MKTSRIVILVLILGAFAGGIAWGAKRFLQNRNMSRVHPQVGEITESVYGLGKVKSNRHFEIKLGVTASIRKRFVREGDIAQTGQKLLELDSGAVFKAPFDGTVTLVSVDEGETVQPQGVILRLENLTDRFIELSLEQEGALRVRRGQKARISFESLRGQSLIGEVTALFPKESEFIANIQVTKLDESILPGMTADVAIEVGKISGTLVPLKALRNGILLVERDGKAKKIKVDVGLIDGLSAEIKGNELKPEDQILVPKE